MRQFSVLAITVVAAIGLSAMPDAAEAQVGVSIGVAPDCPYGYYDTAPYSCAPTGYYGPEWFSGNAFVGAGPWFHGPDNFRGNVNHDYHPEHGYRGAMPNRGDKADAAQRVNKGNFKGNEQRDGRGHATDGNGGKH